MKQRQMEDLGGLAILSEVAGKRIQVMQWSVGDPAGVHMEKRLRLCQLCFQRHMYLNDSVLENHLKKRACLKEAVSR